MLKLIVSLLLAATTAHAKAPVTFLKASGTEAFANELRQQFETDDTRLIRAEKNNDGWTIRVFSKKYHRFDSAKIGSSGGLKMVEAPRLQTKAVCPDDTIQFIGFAPNDDEYELGIVKDVVAEAEAQGLKTILLAKKAATGQAYLNYLACPRVVGDFYDGDANPTEIVTADGTLTHVDFAASMNFNYRVTHIWLACEAYNDPMLTTMITTTRSQKYAAGKNDLIIGPSDEAAACAMKAALHGDAMTAAFQKCYAEKDKPEDQWGFGGDGSDFLGK